MNQTRDLQIGNSPCTTTGQADRKRSLWHYVCVAKFDSYFPWPPSWLRFKRSWWVFLTKFSEGIMWRNMCVALFSPPPPPHPLLAWFSVVHQYFCVTIPPSVRFFTLLWQMDVGSLTCAQIWVHAVHMNWGQAQTRLHKSWLGGSEKLSLTLAHQEIEARVFGLELWCSNHWAMSPVMVLCTCIMRAMVDPSKSSFTVPTYKFDIKLAGQLTIKQNA